MNDDGGSGVGTPAPEYPWVRHGSLRSRVLDYDPEFRVTTTYWYDDAKRQQWLTEDWDVAKVVAQNRALYAQTDERARMTPLGDAEESHMTHVFTVPMALVPDIWKQTHFGKDRAAVSRWLMDPENRHFLVRPIRKGV